MHRIHRKTAPRVVGGRAMRKNRHEVTRGLIDETRDHVLVTRQRPGRGYCHVVTQPEVHRFVALVPDWPALSRGLHAIVLGPGSEWADGRHDSGVITLHAWNMELERRVVPAWYEAHAAVLGRLGVPCEPLEDDEQRRVLCRFDRTSARDFHLVHVLLHELGHHRDRMTTRSRTASRGEDFAESFAREREAEVWTRYCRLQSVG